jgi:hypothetical protein
MRPDFTFPQLNDGFTDPNYLHLHKLAQAGKELRRRDFLYAGTEGKEGPPPAATSLSFEDAGLYVMRSGWDRDARYLLFDAGPYGGPHGHEDKLSVEVYAYGHVFVADPGTYTYDWNDPFRSYFVSSLSHNVITVDGKSQVRRWDKSNMDPKPAHGNYAAWISRPEYDYVGASYENGYSEYSRDRPQGAGVENVIHRRQILFVKPDYWVMVDELQGESPHDYSLFFHAPPGVEATVWENRGVVLSSAPGGACLEILPVNPGNIEIRSVIGSEDPIQGWYGGSGYRSKRPAAAVSMTHKRARSACLTTLLYPRPECLSPQPVSIDALPLRGSEGVAYVVTTPRGKDYLMVSHSEGIKEFGPHRTCEQIALIREEHR